VPLSAGWCDPVGRDGICGVPERIPLIDNLQKEELAHELL
jgi:hypothetical protein